MTDEFPYIVLADDDADDRDFFCLAMKRHYPQIGVLTFQDGDELLAFLDNCTSTGLPVCILIDYKMSRLSAPQFLQQTGTGTPFEHIPKIVWSTSERPVDSEECLGLGAIRFVVKPDSGQLLNKLMCSLEEWLAKPTFRCC
jgi:CheY-like chemotaxis protein